MPGVAVAPNIPAAVASPAPSSPSTAPSDAADSAPTQGSAGFAAVLKQRLAGAKDKPTEGTKPSADLVDPLQALTADAAAAPAQDALAALLPALQGLFTPNAKDVVTSQAQATGEAAPANAKAQVSAPAGASKEAPALQPATQDVPQPAAEDTLAGATAQADKPDAHAANFAAQLAAAAESAGGPTKADAGIPIAELATVHAPVHAQTAHAPAPIEAAAPLRIETPMGMHGWQQELGQKLVLLVGRDEQRAELTLTPPSLGRVEVTITVSGDQTNALFVSPHAEVRDALEEALPKLRELLADAGVQLGQADVSAESSRRDDGSEGNGRSGPRGASHGSTMSTAAPPATLRRADGLVDTFA